ncbi:Kinesin motor domain [Phytophthora infestans]|uniref:Kinesin-like protein n=1 Tax=Phytophthora infestans TaxID=4787 RepID=A0A833T215_PHYIN|nr:Kinesin motor domain [Phytophthora infestans]KAF4141081.1 Kinesin motor domain [Phytophthora infestans]KAI9986468.1 hypothetical protein PInf_025411 [Phytophthora infestans]
MAKATDAAASTRELSSNSDAVQVAVRVRPLSSSEASQGSAACVQVEAANVLLDDKRFHFDAAFPATSKQERVYTTLVAPMVDQFFCGYNATVFAYGQTGSGKTFTMGNDFGSNAAQQNRGVIPRVIENVFKRITASRNSHRFVIKLSYLEILNEEVRDLLPISSDELRQSLSIRGDGERGIFVHGLRDHVVHSTNEALRLLRSGAQLRATAATSMNVSSSRSHAICTLAMEFRQVAAEGVKETRYSKFHLVDLAGSERARRTNTQGARFKEGVNINRGLLALGNVINALSERSRQAHVPYRDSKLTRLLQDSLGGNSKTLMIACISPADVNLEETTNSLRYAARSRKIENQAVINTDRSASHEVGLQRCQRQSPATTCSTVSSLEETNRKLTEELRLAREAKDEWKQVAQKLNAKLEISMKELQDFKDQATKKPAKKRKKRESYETMETWFSSSDEEEDNISADPDYVNDENCRSTKRKKDNGAPLTGNVMDEIDAMLETSAASCCSCLGKCATKACACKMQSRVCSDTCSCNSEKCRNRLLHETQAGTRGVNLQAESTDHAAPSTPTRPRAPTDFVMAAEVKVSPVVDLMSP